MNRSPFAPQPHPGSNRPRFLVLGILLFLTPAAPGQSGRAIESPSARNGKPAPNSEVAVEVRFTDASILKLVIKEERIDVATQYGKLSIPTADVKRVEFGLRIPDDVQKRIDAALADLGNQQYRRREAAGAILIGLREKAYPSVLKATKNPDMEIANRAEELVKKLREVVPAELLQARDYDIIHTETSKFAGKIESAALKASTIQFGEVQLRLADVHVMTAKGVEPEVDTSNVAFAPSNMTQHHGEIGKTFVFKVTGTANGSLWGTDVYTTDSTVAMAAVHCGLVQPGQTGIIKVTMMPSPPAFVGSTRHGVTSSPYQAYPAAYRVHR